MQKSEIFYMIFDILLFGSLFNKVGNFQKLLSRLWFSLNYQINSIFNSQDQENKINHQKSIRPAENCSDERLLSSESVIRREEVEIVMEKLGFFCSTESDEKFEESIELSNLFDEKEPSLGEIKEAFDFYDVNRDGFIDAFELQRVIRLLGLKKEVSGVEDCKRMIRNFDGRIDFNEFVKFMEINLS